MSVTVEQLTLVQKGMLEVGDGHRLNYEVCGEGQMLPILYLHGGPGAGYSESSKRFFSNAKHKVVFFDQRGCGGSLPSCRIDANTTDHLVADIVALLDHLKMPKIILFGGSWGSTLALVFAIRESARTAGMILRGIFLARTKDIEYYVSGGVELFAPTAWAEFVGLVPVHERAHVAQYFLAKMTGRDPEEADRYARAWARYEFSMMSLTDAPFTDAMLKDTNYRSLAVLESHYMANRCFLPENYILENVREITHIQTIIVQGRYDLICPPEGAWRLHKALPTSELKLVMAGHASSEPAIERELFRAAADWSHR